MSTAITTGVLTTGVTTPFTGISYLNAIQVFTDGVNIATVNIYNNTTNSGTIVAKHIVPAASLASTVTFRCPVRMDTAITVEVLGTGASAIVHYGAAG